MVNFTSWSIYLWGISPPPPRYQFDRGLGGPHSRSGHCRQQKHLSPLSETEPRFLGRPAHIPSLYRWEHDVLLWARQWTFEISNSWATTSINKLHGTESLRSHQSLLKNFPIFYENRKFILFTRTRHWSLSWIRWIQSISSHPISLRSILILFSYLRIGLLSGPFPSGSPTKTLNEFVFSTMHATCSTHLILLDLINYICEEYKLRSSSRLLSFHPLCV
jgi:hypothetical protein